MGLPQGEYHLTFGGPTCSASSVVATSTGTYGGCGRQVYVPCATGFDCTDCGRAHSYLSSGRRRERERRAEERASARRLPPLSDTNATLAFLRLVRQGLANGSITDFVLPWPHRTLLERL